MRSARVGLAENPAVAARVWMIPVTKLVILDDHDALREGLAALLPGHGIEVVAAAGTVAAALDIVERLEPDVALVDLQLPDGSGIDLTRELLARRPALGVILYTVATDADLLYGGLDSGARGYALKGGSMAALIGAIQRIAAGGSYVDPRLDPILLSPRSTAGLPRLSPRERELMRLLAEGRTPDQIAHGFLRDWWRRLWRRFRR